jgi:hypothetical protein
LYQYLEFVPVKKRYFGYLVLVGTRKRNCDYLVPDESGTWYQVPQTTINPVQYRIWITRTLVEEKNIMAALLVQKTGCTSKNNNQPVENTAIFLKHPEIAFQVLYFYAKKKRYDTRIHTDTHTDRGRAIIIY